MWISAENGLFLFKQLLLGFFGLAGGGVIAGGVFAFLAMIGVFPRVIGRTGTSRHILLYETVIIVGGVFGNLLDLFHFDLSTGLSWLSGGLAPFFGTLFLALFGLGAGSFVGCLVMSLAETLKAVPVISRRIHLAVGLQYLILAIALGKLSGALVYFYRIKG